MAADYLSPTFANAQPFKIVNFVDGQPVPNPDNPPPPDIIIEPASPENQVPNPLEAINQWIINLFNSGNGVGPNSNSGLSINLPNEIFPNNNYENEFCKTIQFDEHLIEKSIIVILLMLMGIEHAFLGYKHFRQTMFLSGAKFAFIATYFSLVNKTYGNIIMTPQASLAIAGCGSIIVGLLTSMIDYAGLFLTGFYLGCLSSIQCLFIYYFFKGNFSFETNLKYVEMSQDLNQANENALHGSFVQPISEFSSSSPLRFWEV